MPLCLTINHASDGRVACAMEGQIPPDLGIWGQIKVSPQKVDIPLVMTVECGISSQDGNIRCASMQRDVAAKHECLLGQWFGLVDLSAFQLSPIGKGLLVLGHHPVKTDQFNKHQADANGENKHQAEAAHCACGTSRSATFEIGVMLGHVNVNWQGACWQRTGTALQVQESAMATRKSMLAMVAQL